MKVIKYAITACTVNIWSRLSDLVADVDCVQALTSRLDKFWLDQPNIFTGKQISSELATAHLSVKVKLIESA